MLPFITDDAHAFDVTNSCDVPGVSCPFVDYLTHRCTFGQCSDGLGCGAVFRLDIIYRWVAQLVLYAEVVFDTFNMNAFPTASQWLFSD